jgi:hypothetical protein
MATAKSLFDFLQLVGYFISTDQYEIFDNGCLPLPVHFSKNGFYGIGFAFCEELSEHSQSPFNIPVPLIRFRSSHENNELVQCVCSRMRNTYAHAFEIQADRIVLEKMKIPQRLGIYPELRYGIRLVGSASYLGNKKFD